MERTEERIRKNVIREKPMLSDVKKDIPAQDVLCLSFCELFGSVCEKLFLLFCVLVGFRSRPLNRSVVAIFKSKETRVLPQTVR